MTCHAPSVGLLGLILAEKAPCPIIELMNNKHGLSLSLKRHTCLLLLESMQGSSVTTRDSAWWHCSKGTSVPEQHMPGRSITRHRLDRDVHAMAQASLASDTAKQWRTLAPAQVSSNGGAR